MSKSASELLDITGESLRQKREDCGVSLDALAAEISVPGVDCTSLSRFERGFREFSPDQLQAISEAIRRILQRRADMLKEQLG